MAENASQTWSRFNSDFTFPESGDAARVANEVKASIDTWVINSLSKIEAEMRQRAQLNIAVLEQKLAQSKNVLQSIQEKINSLQSAVAQLAPATSNLQEAIDNVKAKTEDARTAMQAAVAQWEQYGNDAVATTVQIAKTLATFV